MKLAIPAQGQTKDALVDRRFGRASHFIVVDPSTQEVRVLPNPACDLPHGAGTAAARLLADEGVGAVLVGDIGPKPVAALRAAGIKIYGGISGTVSDAVYDYLAGRLTLLDSPTVEGNPRQGQGRGGV